MTERTQALRGRSTTLVAAAVAMLAAVSFLVLLPQDAHAADGSGRVSLSDDSGGASLFTGSTGLVPNRAVSKCVNIAATIGSGADPQDIAIGAAGVSGDLAQYLGVTVEVGTGAHYGDCSGFTGSQVYAGTLADLSGRGGGRGVATGWQPTSSQQRSFRFTMVVADSQKALGTKATGTLDWSLVDVGVLPEVQPLPVLPVPAPGPVESGFPNQGVDAAPLPLDSPQPAPAAAAPLTSTAPVPGTKTGAEPALKPATTAAPTSPKRTKSQGQQFTPLSKFVVPQPPGKTDGQGKFTPKSIIPSLGKKLASTVGMLASHVSYPALIAVLIGAFLIIQHKLDSSEPKLAQADVVADRDLVFRDLRENGARPHPLMPAERPPGDGGKPR